MISLHEDHCLSERNDFSSSLPTISLWQPWASWIMWGWKTIETRKHDRFKKLAGKLTGIHAANKMDSNWEELAGPYLTKGQIERTRKETPTLPRGALIGVINVGEAKWLNPEDAAKALIECDTARFGLTLHGPARIDPPIAIQGFQGIFYIPVP